MYMQIKSLAMLTLYVWAVGFRQQAQRSVVLIRTFMAKTQRLTKYVSG